MARKAKSGFERRPYQEHCLQALKKTFLAKIGFALFVLATGLGKTFVAMQFLEWLIRRLLGEDKRKPRVLVMCHQKPILRQLKKNFEEFLGDAYTYALFKPKKKVRHPPEVDVLFVTFQTMRTRRAIFGPEYFDILIVDEGHHSAASSYSKTIKYFKVRFRYSMTATPDRMDLRDIRVLFGPEVYSKPLAQALAEKLLPKVVYKYYLESQGKLASESLKGEKPTRKLLDERFFRARSSPERDQKIADTIVEEMGKLVEPRVLVFCQSITACEAMTTYLVERGIKAAAVHSKIDDDEQEVRLEALKAGTLQVLVARDVLNEGKDIPVINLVAIVRSTASRTVFEQQIGRGLRPGKDELIVLDFVANCDRIQYLAEFVEALKKAKKPRKKKGKKAEQGGDDDVTVCVLQEDLSDVPLDVRCGDIEFEVVYKDLLEVLRRTEDWTVESGKKALFDLARRLGLPTLRSEEIAAASTRNECPSLTWVVKYLAPKTKRLPEALRAAGLEAIKRRWDRDSVVSSLTTLARELGKSTLTSENIQTGSKQRKCPSFPVVLTWLEAKTVEEVNAKLNLTPRGWTVETAKTALRELARTLGKKHLSPGDIEAGSKAKKCPSVGWALENLAPATKSMSEVMKSAGLGEFGWSVETAVPALKAWARKLKKKTLTYVQMDAGSKEGVCPSASWVRNNLVKHGQSMAEALKAIGLSAD